MLRIEVRQGEDWSSGLSGAWDELMRQAEFPTPFQTRQWVQSWPGSRRRRPYVLLAWHGSDLVGLFPLAESGPFRVLRPMAAGPSDYLHPLARAGCAAEVSSLFAERIEAAGRPADLHQVPVGWAESLIRPGTLALEQATCLAIALPPTFSDLLGRLGKSLRTEARRVETDWMDRHGLVLRDATPETVADDLESFFELHARRWRRRGLPGAFPARLRKFHRAWADQAVANGWLWLRTLEREGRPIGCLYAMRAGATCFFYQAGMDPHARSLSPGTVLIASAIRRAIEEGLQTFDMLRGDEPYKRRWKPTTEHRNVRILYPGAGPAGAAATRWAVFGAGVERRVRDRLEGGSLSRQAAPPIPSEQVPEP